MTADDAGRSLVRISFPPGYEFLDPIRSFVSAYLQRRLSERVAERAVIACHELLENAATYGSIASEVVIDVRQPREDDPIEIHVTNAAFEPRRRALFDRISELRRSTAEEAYTRAVIGSPGGKRLLGLARVQYESGMDLDIEVVGEFVTVIARFRPDAS